MRIKRLIVWRKNCNRMAQAGDQMIFGSEERSALQLSSPKRSALLSGLIHGAAIAAILLLTGVKPIIQQINKVLTIYAPNPEDYQPKVAHRQGGGGGGLHENRPASQGALPRTSPRPFVPPVVRIENPNPILPMEQTLYGPDNKPPMLDFAVYGVPNGVKGPPSAGRGKNGGIGDGEDGGIGDKHGPGAGDSDYGVGDIGSRIGASISSPVLLYKTDPEYSEEARKVKLQGTVVLKIDVSASGRAENIVVRQHLGLGLDERAISAVRKWKFKPGQVNGKPAAMTAYVEVNFRLL